MYVHFCCIIDHICGTSNFGGETVRHKLRHGRDEVAVVIARLETINECMFQRKAGGQ